MNVIKRLYQYQDERFPLKVLFFTTWAVVLSSAAILSYQTSFLQMLWAFVACIFFLFHIRVIDEHRDFKHDTTFHPNRPVQRGLISLKELSVFNIFGIVGFAFICSFYGKPSLLYGMGLLVFSFLAWKDFYGGQWLKNQFYLYNAVNMLQMVLLQLLIYAILIQEYTINKVMLIHLLFVIWNTIIMEVVRKIKIASTESKGNDTYSAQMGFKKSLWVFYSFSMANYVTFNWMLYTISPILNRFYFWALLFFILLTVAVFFHMLKRNKLTEGLLFLAAVLNYVGLNLLIYFFNL